MADADISRHEGNFICWDDITIYLKFDGDKIEEYSYDGNPSTVSLAAASFLSEFLIGTDISEVLKRNYETFSQKWFEVSPRRKRAAMIALLAVKNAIYKFKGEDREDDFDDLID